ncbi:dihydroneopterin aldolase [Pedobacter sandarakinus]|uniref:dihydroneopterin aldolase n=1 Tax=Pedobacter sandarakinus TaxID=353156 RepID=UPI002245E929|nr:dihydroneopterin aldolase [Pedobacter sandarakinus]MCX2574355.1 dihydroneopterin aldolase [Pedobacter sandarakinus]
MKNLKQIVALNDVKCFALHGFYPEEQIIGNNFIVDLSTECTPLGFDDEISQTVNYEDLNHVILTEMNKTQKLLETVLHNIIARVIELYPFLDAINVSIKKLNPPMPGQVGCSNVTLSYHK